MPCTMDGYVPPEERPTRSELRALLCAFCRYVEPFHTPHLWPEDVRLWWEAHQLEDAERERKEAAGREAHKAHLRKLRAEIDAELTEVE